MRTKFAHATILTAVLFILLALTACFVPVAYAEEQSGVVSTATDDEIALFVQQLCELNANGSKEQVKIFLEDSFRRVVGEDDTTPVSERKVKSWIFGKDTNYFNIEVTLKGQDTSKQIVIGAHYDAVGEGAGDNACGVAVLYRVFKTLASTSRQLPYNVVFVAFDGEEDGLLGSQNYVDKLEDPSSVLVMFNVDSIALGKQLYLMCENKSTDLADLILKGYDPHQIKEKPYGLGTSQELYTSFGYGYYEMVQGSDHTPFRLKGIPIAFFFSGSYSVGSWGLDTGNTINTSADTYANLTKHAYVERILTVSDAIESAILSQDFVAVAQNARNQLVNLNFWYNSWWPRIAVAVILVVLVVLTILYNRKLQKKAAVGTAEIKTNKVFDKPPAEDIFTFKGQDTKDDGTGVDDIFTFKK